MNSILVSSSTRYFHVEVSVNDSGILYQYNNQLYYATSWSSGTINSGRLTYDKTSFYITFDCINNGNDGMSRIRNFKIYNKNNIQLPHTHISDNIMYGTTSSGNAYNYDNILGY